MEKALEFEGQEITEFFAAIPAVKLEADESYQRGTYLDLQVQVRVRSVRYEETRTGDLQKIHVMAIENVSIAKVTTPQQYREQVEAAEAAAVQDEDLVEEQDLAEPEPVEPSVPPGDDWEADYPQGQVAEAASAGF